MTKLIEAVDGILGVQAATRKPLAVIVAGHNGSGKSTMWRTILADVMQLPLISANRMKLSILDSDHSAQLHYELITETR